MMQFWQVINAGLGINNDDDFETPSSTSTNSESGPQPTHESRLDHLIQAQKLPEAIKGLFFILSAQAQIKNHVKKHHAFVHPFPFFNSNDFLTLLDRLSAFLNLTSHLP